MCTTDGSCSLACDMCAVCRDVFTLPLGFISRLWSLTLAVPGNVLYTILGILASCIRLYTPAVFILK